MKRGNLLQRISRLEAQTASRSDPSGFAPGTPEWLEFWLDWMRRNRAAENPEPRKMPFEVFQVIAEMYQALPQEEREDANAELEREEDFKKKPTE